MTPEQRLYAECINRHILAAIWPFKIPGESTPSLDKQYERFINRKSPVDFCGNTRAATYKSMLWLESSNLDEFAHAADLGDRFINKSFAFVQECIHLRNKLLRDQKEKWKNKTLYTA